MELLGFLFFLAIFGILRRLVWDLPDHVNRLPDRLGDLLLRLVRRGGIWFVGSVWSRAKATLRYFWTSEPTRRLQTKLKAWRSRWQKKQ